MLPVSLATAAKTMGMLSNATGKLKVYWLPEVPVIGTDTLEVIPDCITFGLTLPSGNNKPEMCRGWIISLPD
jgi:hypothetical protein